MSRDYSLEDTTLNGRVLAHRFDCEDVRRLADQGFPVFSLMGCKQPLPAHLLRHDCIKASEGAKA